MVVGEILTRLFVHEFYSTLLVVHYSTVGGTAHDVREAGCASGRMN
jgi:hypothetical protein